MIAIIKKNYLTRNNTYESFLLIITIFFFLAMDYSIQSSPYKYVSYEPQGNFKNIFVPANVYYYVFFFSSSWYTFIYYILTNHPTPPVPSTTTDSWEISFIVAYV